MITILSGCGSAKEQGDKQTEAVNQVEAAEQTETADKAEAAEQTEAADQAEAADKTEAAQSAETIEQPLYSEDQKSCIIQEDESYIYVCGVHRLVKIDKVTGASVILWENKELSDDEEMYLYSGGSGLLINDKIYFVEDWTERTENGSNARSAVSVIQTDGTGYERVEPVSRLINSITMLLQDGMLYMETDTNYVICRKVYEDGTLSEAIKQEEMGKDNRFPEGYSKTGITYYDNGYRTLFVQESIKKFGGVILESYPSLIKVIPETGERFDMSQFGNALEAFNSRYFLISSYDGGSYLVDAETLEGRKIADDRMNVVTMDEDYLYTETKRSEEGQTWQVYEKISLETGERSVIFRQENIKVEPFFAWNDLIDTVVKNGYLYYAGEVDYNLYLMRRNLDDPSKEEILGEAFYDSGIGEVGNMEVYREHISKEGRYSSQRLGTQAELEIDIDLKWLQVDDRFPGAAAINEYLAEAQRQNIAYEKELLEDFITEDEEGEPEEKICEEGDYRLLNHYTSEFSKISYFDNRYLSFYQSEEDYGYGMAHGILYRIGYTFDLQTGERLVLEDVIANSEEELKDIVTKYFGEMILTAPELYWDDALDTVRERTDLESSFYLAEGGIRFYFGPYALACFAAGFQEVTIPYEEFEMRIPVGNPPQ